MLRRNPSLSRLSVAAVSKPLDQASALSLWLDVLGFWTFVAGHDVEHNQISWMEGFMAFSQDGRVMQKNVLSSLLGDEAIAALFIPPFNFSTRHN